MKASSSAVKLPRKRLFYLDFIRAIATFIIVLTHFNNPYLAEGDYLFTNNPFGIYVGGLGVSLFLILSGAALTLTYKHPLDYKKFYWKRFLGIYPMFWTAWIVATMYFFLALDGHVLSNAPLRNIVFTLFGVDGLAANFQVQTFYLLGEWFLGFILLFYLIFPLMLWAVSRFPIVTAGIILALWGISLWYFVGSGLPTAMLLPIRLPELAFGMYFMMYMKKFPLWAALPAVIVLITLSFYPDFHEEIATTLVGISAFILLTILGTKLDHKLVRPPFDLISKYSYQIFLVHHVIIMEIYRTVQMQNFVWKQYYFTFAIVCVLSFVFAVVLTKLTNLITQFCRSWFSASETP